MDLYTELARSVTALNAAGVGYAVVGGVAVSIYAAPRATEDIDLLVAPADLEVAVMALGTLGFRVAGAPMEVARGRLRIQRLVKFEGGELLPLDLLIARDAELAGLVDEREVVDWDGTPTPVIRIAALRMLKRLRGSAQDRADLEALGPEP